MEVEKLKKLSRSLRIILLISSVVISLLLVCNVIPMNTEKGIAFGNGLDFGIDFAGGVQLILGLDKPLTDEMATEKGILLSRINAKGLKDISVRPWGDSYIIINVVNASPQEIEEIKNILKQPARFEQRIDGELVVKGDEISIDPSPSASGLFPRGDIYEWVVGVQFNPEGAARFGKAAEDKFYGEDDPRNRPVDLFIDRPVNTTILMDKITYSILSNKTSTSSGRGDIFYGDAGIEIIENRSLIPVIVLRNNTNEIISEIEGYLVKGYTNMILAGDDNQISEGIRARVEDLGIETERRVKGNLTYQGWIQELTGLKTSPRLNFNTGGKPVYGARITGSADTLGEAKRLVEQNKIWLSFGNLPAKASIESESTIEGSLAADFLRNSFIIGLISILVVTLMIYIRYRRPFIVVPTLVTGFSEIIIILGFASLINWQIDLVAMAGIIAAVGTGVDDQIVITDETIRRGSKKKIVSMMERIRRAFFIIFTAAATTIAVMLPVFTIQALQGFAFTTVSGILIGVGITRPAYAKIIEEMLKE